MTSTNEIEKLEKSVTSLLKTDTRGRVQIPVEKREELLKEFDRSTMTGVAFAKWVGIPYTTLAGWLRNRRVKNPGIASLKKKEVKWVEAVVAGKAAVGGEVVIHLSGGIRVDAPDSKSAIEILKELGVKVC